MSYSFRRFIEQQFASQLHDAAADYIEYDNIHDISVHIQSVTIEDSFAGSPPRRGATTAGIG